MCFPPHKIEPYPLAGPLEVQGTYDILETVPFLRHIARRCDENTQLRDFLWH